jgi:hypothetical protein
MSNAVNRIRQAVSLALVVLLAGVGTLAQAQFQRAYRISDRQLDQMIRRIETRTDNFTRSLGNALNLDTWDETRAEARREERLSQLVQNFEQATDALRTRFNNRQSTASDVETVLNRAARIDNFIQRQAQRRNNIVIPVNATRQWQLIKSDLNQLADAFNITSRWDSPIGGNPRGANNRLTGTFRLNRSQSEDARSEIEQVVRNLPAQQRDRAFNALMRRVDAPEMIAIERRGTTITLASSRAAQATFEADGREQVEQYPNSRINSRTRASLSGEILTISSTGARATDFTVTFEPINNGRQLRVTRSLYAERLTQPVSITSVYDQVSNVAQWNVYTGVPASPSSPGNIPGGTLGGFIVPDNVMLETRLDQNLATDQTREGDRFTLTVLSPSQYAGATIEGYVTQVDRSGRLAGRSEMALALESIRMRNGQTYRFEGIIETVRTPQGEEVRVNNEGVLGEDSTQGRRTATRGAIGGALGAVLGAILGGGSGAAIGAIVGAGAGAGSVYVSGRDDLRLTSGTELTIRSVTPPNSTAIR